MPREPRRRIGSDVPLLVLGAALFVAYVWVLTHSTAFVVAVLGFFSDDRPQVYATFLAVLVGLPGLLWTLPRALRRAPRRVAPGSTVTRRDVPESRPLSRTDVLGIAVVLLAQVPLPAPWGTPGKAATVANVTRSPEIVEVSTAFASLSVAVLAVGVGAAVLAKVYAHAAAQRVVAIILVVGAPVVAWVLALRTLR